MAFLMRASVSIPLAFVVHLAACGGGASGVGPLDPDTAEGRAGITIPNPTGTCVAPDSGARAGYHSPDGSTWLPDCQNMLRREYWRVFARTADSAYLIPRPDGAAGLQDACTDSTHALHDVAVKHALCSPASSTEQVERVNAIPPADALAVAHHLHASLRFLADDVGISPFPLSGDIVDACALHETASNPELDALCQRERRRLEDGDDIAFSYTGPGAERLAIRLNELYGIPLD
jgi:hypothetical protein